VYINKGIDFIGNFSISTANIAQIKAAAARSITSNQYGKEVSFVIYSVKSAKDHRLVGLHALKLLNSKVTDDTRCCNGSQEDNRRPTIGQTFSDNMLNDIDQLFKLINND
jgi:hypothetical protein